MSFKLSYKKVVVLLKKLLLCLSILLTLTSCSLKKDEMVYLLANEENIIAFSEEEKNVLVLYFTPSVVQDVMNEEGLTSQELFKALYGVDKLSVVNISSEEVANLRRLLHSLSYISGGDVGLHAYSTLEKGLRKTEFIDTIKALVSDKNGDSFLSLLDKDKNIIVLSGDDLLSHTAPWEEKVSFFKTWCTEIGVYIKK